MQGACVLFSMKIIKERRIFIMLIPVKKPNEKTIYEGCQHLKDVYKDGAVVGLYAAYFIDNQWVYHLGKTVLKNNKVRTIDHCIIYCDENTDWTVVNKKFSQFLKGVKCVINYAEHSHFESAENLDIEVMAMYCQYYFHHRGLKSDGIEYARNLFEYGEGVNGINMYDLLTAVISDILDNYEKILKQDEDKTKSE